MTWAHRHPYLAGALALVLLLLFILWLRRRSAGVSAGAAVGVAYGGPSEGLQAAELQAGVQTQALQYDLAKTVAGYTAAQNVATIQDAGQTQRQYYDDQTKLAELAYQHDLGQLQLAGQVAAAGAQAEIDRGGGQYVVFGATQASLNQRSTELALQRGIAQAVAQQPAAAAQLPAFTAASTPANAGGVITAGNDGTAALPFPGAAGQQVHGVTETYCSAYGSMADQAACAAANQAAVEQSYQQHAGSYLGNGIYAGTPEAAAAYGPGSGGGYVSGGGTPIGGRIGNTWVDAAGNPIAG